MIFLHLSRAQAMWETNETMHKRDDAERPASVLFPRIQLTNRTQHHVCKHACIHSLIPMWFSVQSHLGTDGDKTHDWYMPRANSLRDDLYVRTYTLLKASDRAMDPTVKTRLLSCFFTPGHPNNRESGSGWRSALSTRHIEWLLLGFAAVFHFRTRLGQTSHF